MNRYQNIFLLTFIMIFEFLLFLLSDKILSFLFQPKYPFPDLYLKQNLFLSFLNLIHYCCTIFLTVMDRGNFELLVGYFNLQMNVKPFHIFHVENYFFSRFQFFWHLRNRFTLDCLFSLKLFKCVIKCKLNNDKRYIFF